MACTPHDDAIAHTGGGSTSRQTATSPAEDEVRRYRSQGARPPVLGLRDTIALAPETNWPSRPTARLNPNGGTGPDGTITGKDGIGGRGRDRGRGSLPGESRKDGAMGQSK